MTKPVPPFIRQICTPYLDQLCPVAPPCPMPPPCPDPVTKIGIDSLFSPLMGLSVPLDSSIADLATWKAIGVRSIVISVMQDSPDLSYFIGIARQVGLKIILSTPQANWQNWDEDAWIAQVQSLGTVLANYDPDGWYVAYEVNIGWGDGASAYQRAIPILRALKDVTIYLSPYYWEGPPMPSDTSVRSLWDSFCSQVSQVSGSNVISALQDGVGCDYNIPRRVIGTPAYQDFLNKAKIHKEVCEAHGWKATINIELFDTYPETPNSIPYPATADRIKDQIQSEGKADYVSNGMGLGPCFEGTGISLRKYDASWCPYHQDVAMMLLKGD